MSTICNLSKEPSLTASVFCLAFSNNASCKRIRFSMTCIMAFTDTFYLPLIIASTKNRTFFSLKLRDLLDICQIQFVFLFPVHRLFALCLADCFLVAALHDWKSPIDPVDLSPSFVQLAFVIVFYRD